MIYPVSVGTTSTTQFVTVSNTGNTNLTFTSAASFSPADYAVAGSGTCLVSQPVAPSGSCTISVKFTPTTTGTRNGTMIVTTNAPGALTGIGGSGSNLSLNANLLAFGSVAQGNISAGKTVTVTNIGNSDLHFTGTTTLSANFATANIGTCGSGAVTPGSSCTLSAEFVPTADGSIAGTMTIFTDAPGSTTTVALSGIGAPTLWPGATHVHVPAQYATIQAAIDAAVNGSNTVIHVGPGTYIENLDINKSGVDGTHRFVLVSDQKWGAKIVAATSPPQPFHFMIHVEANYVDIIGFEITGGSVGGGVSMSTVNGSPNLRMSEF